MADLKNLRKSPQKNRARSRRQPDDLRRLRTDETDTGDQQILRGIHLEVATGETLVIIGRSGGGKSVLLKHLIRMMIPTSASLGIKANKLSA